MTLASQILKPTMMEHMKFFRNETLTVVIMEKHHGKREIEFIQGIAQIVNDQLNE